MQKTAPLYQVVLGVIGSDCHAVGNRIIATVLEQEGIAVHNLGVMVTQDEFIDAAIESGADAVLVSSIYGHGEIDCAGLRKRFTERGLGDILLCVGGNLVVGKRDFAEVVSIFEAMGFDRVCHPDVDLEEFAAEIKAEIDDRRLAQEPLRLYA